MNKYGKRNIVIVASMVLLLCLSMVSSTAAYTNTGDMEDCTENKIRSSLAFLQSIEEHPEITPASADVSDVVSHDFVSVDIEFGHELSQAEIQSLETIGINFVKIDGNVAHTGRFYGANVPWTKIDTLVSMSDIVQIDSTWHPGIADPLDVSIPEINADDVWQLLDAGGRNITGEGIRIADFDTGIDVFHPDFWQADGGSYNWIDTNGNNAFNPGIDAVDLNGNGVANAGETLNFFDGDGPAGNNDGVFQADMDWLYNDVNGNGLRDYGTASGFVESDPTYGERLFIVNDSNNNNALDIGEDVIALGTNKVYKTLNTGGVERTRGTNLIFTDGDSNGHGTSVCGILNGGTIGKRNYVGVSPNAELLVADRYANDYTVYIPWAKSNGANIMLYEFGGWVWDFLDGSSPLEQRINTEASDGIVQVVPAGNLAGGDKHFRTTVPSGGSTDIDFNVPVLAPPSNIREIYMTVLWLNTSNDLAFNITTSAGGPGNIVNLPGTSTWVNTADGHRVWSRREDSTRGTAKFDIKIERVGGGNISTGVWTLTVINNDISGQEVNGYITDQNVRWSGGAVFQDFVDDSRTVTYPATADSAITVASYSTRGWGVAVGDLSTFSGRGPRIDGQTIVDVAAPGNYDIGSAASNASSYPLGSYRWFGGTSAAGPHVAGTCALMLQKKPSLTHTQIKQTIQDTAREDAFTGVTPNSDWGYGKLDAFASVSVSPIEKGLQYLRTQQNPDGSWSNDVGITSLAALAFLNAGYNETDPDVQDAIGYIRSKVQGDGSIYSYYYSRTYQTSLAVLALVATHNNSYDTIINNAANWLKDSQWDEDCLWGSVNKDHWYYGGFGYGRNVRPDNSNTQFALMALDAVLSISKGDLLWDKAQVFLARVQNREANVTVIINGTPYNVTPDYNFYDDGGFVYHPGRSLAPSGKSYGSMTGAGIWGLRLSNVGKDDPRVEAALDWVINNYMWDGNPGMSNPGSGQYYYYLSMSKALTMTEPDLIGGHNWYQDLSSNLTALQKPEGYWINERDSWFWENNKDLVTSYAILSLQTRGEIPPDIQRLSWLTFILHSNADLQVYDPLGRHVGMNYDTGEIEIQIPNATYSADPQNITIPELIPGNYRIVLVGTGTGEYTLDVTGGVGDEIVSEDSFTSTISEGEVHDANVNVAMITWLTIHVDDPEPTDAMVQSATGTGNVSFVADSGTIEDLTALNESDLPEENTAIDFPHGLFIFNITGLSDGETVNVTIDFPQNIPTTAQYWKYHTPEGWYPIPMGSNDGDNIITIQLTDGGIGDDDGIANGVIVDQGGPGVSAMILATVDFDPDTLNKKSKGKWVTVYTELPAGYNVTDINVSTMMLNETVSAELHPTEVGDYDSDGIPDLMVKFDRQAVIDILPIGDAVSITVTGRLTDGTQFEGSDTVRVIDEG